MQTKNSRNITVHKNDNTEQLFRLTFENAAVGMAHIDSNGKFIRVNQRLAKITGYPKEDLLQKTFQEITHPDDLAEDLQKVEDLRRGEIDSYSMEKRYFKNNGDIVWVNLTVSAVRGTSGEMQFLVSIIEDVTDRKNLEVSLHKSEQRVKMAFKAAKIGAYNLDLQTGENYWSAEALAIYGLNPSDTLPMNDGIPASVHPDDREAVITEAKARFNRTIDPEFNSEHRIVLSDGEIRWLIIRGRVEFDEENHPVRSHGIVMDITDEKRTQDAMRKKMEESDKLLDIMPAAIFISEDPQCNHMRANRMAKEFYEAEENENVSANVNNVRRFFRDGKELSPEELPMQKATRENSPVYNDVLKVLLESGRWIYMHGSAMPLNDEKGNVRGAIAAFVDITNHVTTEKALKENEEKFRMLANNISQLAWMADEKGWIFWYNKRWFDYTGTTLEEMQGWGWKKVHHPDYADAVVKKIQHSWDTGKVWEDLFPLRGKNGEYRWFLSRAIPIRNDEGQIVRWFGTNTDVTEQREMENLLKKDKELVENLLYITAHDLKGPVANMYQALNYMNRLETEGKLKLIGKFQGLTNQLDKTIKGVTDILRVRNTDESSASRVYFEAVLNDIQLEFKEILSTFHLQSDFSEKKSIHYIEPFLFSIMKNLISNSIKYCRDDVSLKIEIRTKRKKNYTLLTISDNGIGMDLSKYGEKLFSPFQRFSDKKTKGTGIGLYLVKSIIEKNGGYIEVESIPGKGTTFNCFLKGY